MRFKQILTRQTMKPQKPEQKISWKTIGNRTIFLGNERIAGFRGPSRLMVKTTRGDHRKRVRHELPP